MFLLFFSFLKIDFLQVFHDIRKKALILFILCLFKLCVIPVGLFFLTQAIWPEYAVPVLLLSGISTGVVAPLFRASGGLHAARPDDGGGFFPSIPLFPPALVSLLVGQTIEISFLMMMKVLAMVIFLPAITAIFLRYLFPSF